MNGKKMPEHLVVLIVDDDVSVSRSTRQLLDSSFGLPVCSTFSIGLSPVPLSWHSSAKPYLHYNDKPQAGLGVSRAPSMKTRPNRTNTNFLQTRCKLDRQHSLMLVTALSPVFGYDKSSKTAHYALDNDLTLKEGALKLGFVTEDEFERVVDPAKMVHPCHGAAEKDLEARRWLFCRLHSGCCGGLMVGRLGVVTCGYTGGGGGRIALGHRGSSGT